jgi:NitT/TauT family transport system ATP-binding protein
MTIVDNKEARATASAASHGEASAARSAVALRGITKAYGQGERRVVALDGLDLDVAPGEFVCVVGASGCGKTTMLNLIADLDEPSAGSLDVDGRVALMFQEAALLPWRTAGANVELALKLGGTRGRASRRQRAIELLRTVHLDDFASRRPHELSGGMRQRVALARAFAQDADILLMDEPFGALDAMTRDLLHHELEALWLDARFTVVFVTHNVREAVRLGDRVVLLSSRPGRIVDTFPVDLARPRRIESPEVSSLASTITDRLREEVRRHGQHDRG